MAGQRLAVAHRQFWGDPGGWLSDARAEKGPHYWSWILGARLSFARFLLQLGDLIQSLAVVVMRPDDLVEFSRQSYASPDSVGAWAEDELVDSGLVEEELDLLAEVQERAGDLLLLGVGGGREAVPLARMGFRVTGVDYIPEMVDEAIANASRRSLQIEGLVQEISRLDVPAGAYDLVWLSRSMYSSVPTRARRVEMVRRVAAALKPGGLFLCQFQWRPDPPARGVAELARRLVAVITLGNLSYEPGDRLWLDVEFVHQFSSEDSIRSELEQGDLSVLRIQTYPGRVRGWAVCRKPLRVANDQQREIG